MKIILQLCLAISLLLSTSCARLWKSAAFTDAERCALIGQIQEGTQIGNKTVVGSVGDTVYSYDVPTYNPVCKKPKTAEEQAMVEDLQPAILEKMEEQNKRLGIAAIITIGLLGGIIGLAAIAKSEK